MGSGQNPRQLGKRCLPICQSDSTGPIDVALAKLLTRVRGLPAPDRGLSVTDKPIMEQCGRLSLLASPAASPEGQCIGLLDPGDAIEWVPIPILQAASRWPHSVAISPFGGRRAYLARLHLGRRTASWPSVRLQTTSRWLQQCSHLSFHEHAGWHASLLPVHGGNTFAAFHDVASRAGRLLEGAGRAGPLHFIARESSQRRVDSASFPCQEKKLRSPSLFLILAPVPAGHQSDEWTPFFARVRARKKGLLGSKCIILSVVAYSPFHSFLPEGMEWLLRLLGKSKSTQPGPSPARLLICSLRCAPRSRRA